MVLRCYVRFDVDATTVSIFASMMMNDCNDLFDVDDGSNLRHLLVISLEKNERKRLVLRSLGDAY